MNTTTTITILGIWLFVVSIIISSTTCAIIKISGIDQNHRAPSIGPGPGGQPLLVDTSGIQSSATVSGINNIRLLLEKNWTFIFLWLLKRNLWISDLGGIISKYAWSKTIFINAKILILQDKKIIFAFTKILWSEDT